MPTVILRPDAIQSSTGFNISGQGLQEAISDNGAATTAIQNNVTANLTCTFGNNSAYTGGTINNLVVSVTGGSTGRGTPGATSVLHAANESVLNETSMTFAGGTTTQTSSTITEDAGGSALTPTIVDGMFLVFTPNTTGMFIAEIFVTVDYTAGSSGYENDVMGVAVANIEKIMGVSSANIEKIIGV